MRLATRMAAKVIAVSYKDRSAILPGGLRPNAAYWFNTATGMFVSSDYYLPQLPPWVVRFNGTRRPDRFFGAQWDLALPEEAYRRAQAETLPVQGSALGDAFPHLVTGGEAKPGELFHRAFELTPFASDHLAEFATAAIDGEALGSSTCRTRSSTRPTSLGAEAKKFDAKLDPNLGVSLVNDAISAGAKGIAITVPDQTIGPAIAKAAKDAAASS